ncbi:MAG: tetratricopeptide repeat protein [Acidobacteria bacterium]|nr:tetratricopeptide repeat protein [Acidobacteriota bacterium]MBI3421795.1 tetratricopeptide repeat protein [Acidobacteriota bacterium]
MNFRRKQIAGKMRLGLLLSLLLLAQAARAQTTNPPAPAPRALNDILALEDPAARLTSLQQFLKTNATGEAALTAREAVVFSYSQIGEAQLNDNNIEKAVEAFQRAIKALPKQVSDQFFEDTVVKIPMAVSTRGYRAEAVTLGKLLETRFANEAERLAALGEYYLSIEASGEAINTLENATHLAPEDARLQRALGAAYRMGLRIGDAIAAYQLAVRYDPKDRRAFYDLANLYRSQGAYEDALKLYQKQLEIDPKHTASHKGLALAYTALGKEDEATAALNQVRDLRGSSDEIRQDILLQTQLAFYYLAQNKLKAARQAAEAALLVEPRFSWARIAAAEVELAEGKYFEAERHLLAAQKYAGFPTLAFTLAKLYLIVEDFDGASEWLGKAFRYSAQDKFTTRLGGVRDVQADELRDLLAPEHQAAIFLAEPPTSDELFKIAESLTRVNARLTDKTPDNKTAAPAAKETGKENNPDLLEQSARTFVEAEGTRRSFRALYMARRLAQAGKALPLAVKFADQALELAEVATEAEGSVRDYPNYDREGRLRTFRGRAYDARGWALFKANQNPEAVRTLSQAVLTYGPLPEGKEALRHLSAAKEAAGELPVALELALAAYETPADKNTADLNRSVVESLYRKVHGSLNGLGEKLGQPLSAKTAGLIAAAANAANHAETQTPTTTAANTGDPAPTTAKPEFNVNQLLVNRPNEANGNERRPALSTPTRGSDSGKTAQTEAANPPSAEKLRVGLYGIPVNPKTANGGRPNFPLPPPPKPQPRATPEPATKTAAVNPPPAPAATPIKEPVIEKAAEQQAEKAQVAVIAKELPKEPSAKEPSAKEPSAKELAAKEPEKLPEKLKENARETAPVTTPTTTAENAVTLPPITTANTEAAARNAVPPATEKVAEKEPAPTLARATENEPEKGAEKEPEKPLFVPPSTPLTVPEIRANNASAVETSAPAPAQPVSLPELPADKPVQLAVTYAPDPAFFRRLRLVPAAEEEPPAPLVPAPNITVANPAEPPITVRYEAVPTKPADNAAPAEPPPPVNTRPRRVNELIPVNQPTPSGPAANGRKRRVAPPPAKP